MELTKDQIKVTVSPVLTKDRIEEVQSKVEHEILKTPSGELRNLLSEVNIILSSILEFSLNKK